MSTTTTLPFACASFASSAVSALPPFALHAPPVLLDVPTHPTGRGTFPFAAAALTPGPLDPNSHRLMVSEPVASVLRVSFPPPHPPQAKKWPKMAKKWTVFRERRPFFMASEIDFLGAHGKRMSLTKYRPFFLEACPSRKSREAPKPKSSIAIESERLAESVAGRRGRDRGRNRGRA